MRTEYGNCQPSELNNLIWNKLILRFSKLIVSLVRVIKIWLINKGIKTCTWKVDYSHTQFKYYTATPEYRFQREGNTHFELFLKNKLHLF